MSDEISWETRPAAGWEEYRAARERFLTKVRPGRVVDASIRAARWMLDGYAVEYLPLLDLGALAPEVDEEPWGL